MGVLGMSSFKWGPSSSCTTAIEKNPEISSQSCQVFLEGGKLRSQF